MSGDYGSHAHIARFDAETVYANIGQLSNRIKELTRHVAELTNRIAVLENQKTGDKE